MTENASTQNSDTKHQELQLLQFCTATVNLACKAVLDPYAVGNVGDNQLPNFKATVDKSKTLNLGKALFCLELHNKNAVIYQRFDSACRKVRKNLQLLEHWHESETAHIDLGVACQAVLRCYNACFPLYARFTRVKQPIALSAVCSYKTDEFEIDARKRYVLLENSEEMLWTVSTLDEQGAVSGESVRVPALFFLTNWQPKDAEELASLLDQARNAFRSYLFQLIKLIKSEVADVALDYVADVADLTKEKIASIEACLRVYLDRHGIVSEPRVKNFLCTAYETAKYFLMTPESVCDRSAKYFRTPEALLHNEPLAKEEKLVRMEWKMQLVLNVQSTTTETTEILPRNVDLAVFKQSEQEIERKMVIRTVVDPCSNRSLSLEEALASGVLVYQTGLYSNPRTGQSISIAEAIMKQMILVEELVIERMQESNKSFGVLTMQNFANHSEVHYLVHAAIDRKNEDRLDFDTAVGRELIDLDRLTFYDTLSQTAIPVADALEKGYLKGRKLDSVAELEELRQSQSDIVKARVKKLTSSIGVIGELKRRSQQAKMHDS